ncbi:MAG: hypothetical protein D4R73_09200 [Deltaproteobacteria bacterium]|nr:MAG: hypothetical protein D4R73_09200 [Deltaproteobacteria bacterium]
MSKTPTHETNEKAMKAMSLYRQNMSTSQIGLYLGVKERNVRLLLARARKLWALIVDSSDSKTLIGESLAAFEEIERVALENFAKVDPNGNVAVGYLNVARGAREQIKKLQQESGLTIFELGTLKVKKSPDLSDLTPEELDLCISAGMKLKGDLTPETG